METHHDEAIALDEADPEFALVERWREGVHDVARSPCAPLRPEVVVDPQFAKLLQYVRTVPAEIGCGLARRLVGHDHAVLAERDPESPQEGERFVKVQTTPIV